MFSLDRQQVFYEVVPRLYDIYYEIIKFLTSKNFNIYEGEPYLINKGNIYIGIYVENLLII